MAQVEPRGRGCYHLGVRSLRVLTALLAASVLAACGGKAPAVHWPRSAGSMAVDDPALDGGESLEPHQLSDEAAAVESGGLDITSILDEPAVPPPAAATPTSAAPTVPAVEAPAETLPIFDEIIIVN
jgi:hypothetical protein